MPPRWARKLSWMFGPVGMVLLAACYGPAGRYQNTTTRPNPYQQDRDRDGSLTAIDCTEAKQTNSYERNECERQRTTAKPEPTDCDDNDASRYPGAADMVGDGIDQNCDGIDGWRDPSVVVQPVNAVEPAPAEGATIATPPST